MGLLATAYGVLGKARDTALGYRAATISRETIGPRPTGGSADRHLRYDRQELANRADAFYRDNGIYRGVVNRFVEAVFGSTGFMLDPDYGSDKINRRVKARWASFCESPEVRGLFTWRDMERLALLSVVNHGDVGAIHTSRGKFQLVEAEEIGGPARLTSALGDEGQRWESGVLLDREGAPLRYRIHARNGQGYVMPGTWRDVGAENFTHLAHRERPSQTRGVPVLTPVFPMVDRLNDVCDSEAVAWQQLSRFSVAVTREGGPGLAWAESSPDADGRAAGTGGTGSGSTLYEADAADRVIEFEAGTVFHANPGESITSIDRNLPGPNFPQSVRMFLRLIGLPIGMPLEQILLDYSQTNYSSARASLEQAYRAYSHWQSFLKRSWHTPLYRRWLGWEIEAGRLPRHTALLADAEGEERGHLWIAPNFPWIDAKAEAEAWATKVAHGFATHGEVLASLGIDRDDFLRARAAEVVSAEKTTREVGQTVTDDGGQDPGLHWRELSGLPVSLAVSAPQQGPALEVHEPEQEEAPGEESEPELEHHHDDLKPGESCPHCGGDGEL